MNLGFIGTGAIAAATIRGLCAAHGHTHPITVSPRSLSVAKTLAETFAQVTRARTNQQVVDASDAVFLAIRPEQLSEVCASLTFRPGQIVISLLAGTPPAKVAASIKAPVQVCRFTPLPMIERGEGPIVLQDAPPEIAALLAPLGQVIIAHSDADMEAFGVASGLMSSILELALASVSWMAGREIAPYDGRDYLLSMVRGLTTTLLNTPIECLADIVDHHETAGGLNEHCRNFLTNAGAFALIQAAMTSTEAHGRSLGAPPVATPSE